MSELYDPIKSSSRKFESSNNELSNSSLFVIVVNERLAPNGLTEADLNI